MAKAERNLYDVLGVDRRAEPDAIKRAFRDQARTLHPDVSGDPDAAERFSELSRAYGVLSKPAKRILYDRLGYLGHGNGGFEERGEAARRAGRPARRGRDHEARGEAGRDEARPRRLARDVRRLRRHRGRAPNGGRDVRRLRGRGTRPRDVVRRDAEVLRSRTAGVRGTRPRDHPSPAPLRRRRARLGPSGRSPFGSTRASPTAAWFEPRERTSTSSSRCSPSATRSSSATRRRSPSSSRSRSSPSSRSRPTRSRSS